jgi:hypothetical protein
MAIKKTSLLAAEHVADSFQKKGFSDSPGPRKKTSFLTCYQPVDILLFYQHKAFLYL